MPRTSSTHSAARLRSENGFTMVVTMAVISFIMMATLMAMNVVMADQPVGSANLQKKKSSSAADAAVQVYTNRLISDNAYWSKCTDTANGVNPFWDGKTADNRTWVKLPDHSARWTIELLPANGAPQCKTSDPVGTTIDKATTAFRIRVTGQALDADEEPTGKRTSLIITYKHRSFLDYIYYTDFEVMDPTLYPAALADNAITKEDDGRNNVDADGHARSVSEWGNQACAVHAYRPGPGGNLRASQLFQGTGNRGRGQYVGNKWYDFKTDCVDIRFVTGDVVQGPMHTNDSPLICGTPVFGRYPTDTIETSAPNNGAITDPTKSYRKDSGCSGNTPDVNFVTSSTQRNNRGTWASNQPLMNLPPSNTELKTVAESSYRFVGLTTFVFNGGTMRVTGKRADGSSVTNQTMSYPPNGVVYVDNDPAVGCLSGYRVDLAATDNRTGCGIARVSGSYNTSMTIAAADDIMIMGNTLSTASDEAMLGLIANNFIRVNHPVASQTECAAGRATSNSSGSVSNLTINAALLSLQHSFLIDNWMCGAQLGTLTVYGAISQSFRGPVGTGTSSNPVTGYLKNYIYNDNLKAVAPPYFLDPVQSSWRATMYQEQVPAS